ncbi:MAG TPA: hypothetical protein VME66_07550 [Candidatus Acidoferrales bacterium]|nr:hypothetical protein [Candidatus Acidoferrales bacterium]
MIARISGEAAASMIRLRTSVGVAVLLFAACVAALLTHVAIDVAGDYWLARDAYDTLAHHSRLATLIGISAIAVALFAAIAARAIADVRGKRGALREALEALVGGSATLFSLRVAVLSLAVLIAMETLDSLLATGTIEDLPDAFGGSIAFGLAFALPISLTVAFGTWKLARSMIRLLQPLLRVVGALLQYLIRTGDRETPLLAAIDTTRRGVRSSLLARCAGLRAPPHRTALQTAP